MDNFKAVDTAVESHGIFQFAAEDEWLLSILEAEDVAPKKQRHFIDWDYKMRATFDGWFHKPEETHATTFHTKTGPNELINSMEHYYLGHNYQRALGIALIYLHQNGTLSKPLKQSEVLEIAARCYLKLGNPHKALEICTPLESSREPGHMLFRAQLYRQTKNAPQCIAFSMKYLRHRPNDPTTFQELKELFLSIPIPQTTWALHSLVHAKHLLTRSHRADTPISQRHGQHELSRIDEEIDQLRSSCGDTGMDEQGLGAIGLSDEQVEWLKKTLLSCQANGDEAVEEEEDVRGLEG